MFALFEYPLSDFSDIEEALSLMGSFENRPLIVIAPLIRGEALSTIKVNRENNIVQSYAIEAPLVTWGKGWLEDVASYVGATPHNKFLHGEFQTHYFGSAREITIKDKEIILDPYDDHVEVTSARISQLLAEAENTPFPHTQDQLKRRASNLSGSLIRLRIGGSTETEARIRRNKAEKNLLSLSDMVQYGHVLGEAKTLSDISNLFPYPLNKALCAPLKVISLNKQQPNLSLLLEDHTLKHPFPTHRLVNLVTRAISLAHTLGSVGLVLRSQK
jgi:chaperonin GroEL (HSP60 family)